MEDVKMQQAGTKAANEPWYPTYRLTEIVGTATGSVDDAIANGIDKAAESLHGLSWFQVVEIRGSIHDGKVSDTQVAMKVGFRVD